jgi:4-hydroxy-3-polyprenylbenzoate decarboxylase
MRVAVGVTGASGAIVAERLVAELLNHVERVHLMFTEASVKVVAQELQGPASTEGFSLKQTIEGGIAEDLRGKLRVYGVQDLFAPIASGSSVPDAMVIVPCSMGTLSRVSHGFSSNLLERSADVVLKEKRNLVICPRESPLSSIHLENMLRLANQGVTIAPLMPAFYTHPASIDDMIKQFVGRILDLLQIENRLVKRWNHRLL